MMIYPSKGEEFPKYLRTFATNSKNMIQITDIPSTYPICEKADCPKAAHCLHQMAYAPLRKQEPKLHLINPDFCEPGESCPFYKDATPVRFAFGFTNFQKNMFPEQYDHFRILLTTHYGHTGYFRRRRGEKPLSPEEQQFIEKTAKSVGVSLQLEFDRYEERLCWDI